MFGGIKSNHAESCAIQRKSVVIFSKQISTGKYNCWIFIQEKLRYRQVAVTLFHIVPKSIAVL